VFGNVELPYPNAKVAVKLSFAGACFNSNCNEDESPEIGDLGSDFWETRVGNDRQVWQGFNVIAERDYLGDCIANRGKDFKQDFFESLFGPKCRYLMNSNTTSKPCFLCTATGHDVAKVVRSELSRALSNPNQGHYMIFGRSTKTAFLAESQQGSISGEGKGKAEVSLMKSGVRSDVRAKYYRLGS
jgi:hypothetical protein